MTSLIRITMVVLTCIEALSNARVTYALAPGTHLLEQERRDLIQRIVGMVAVEGPNLREAIRALEEAQERHPETFSEDFRRISDLLVLEYMRTDLAKPLQKRIYSSITRLFHTILKNERLGQVHHQAAKSMARYLDLMDFLKVAKNFKGDIIAGDEEGDFRLIEELAFILNWTVNPKTNRVFLTLYARDKPAKYRGGIVDAVRNFKRDFMKGVTVNPNIDLKTIQAIFAEYDRQRKERVAFREMLAKVSLSSPWKEPLAYRELFRQYGDVAMHDSFTHGTLIVDKNNYIILFQGAKVRVREAEVGELVRVNVLPIEDGIPLIQVFSKISEGKLLCEGYYNKRRKAFYTLSEQFELWFQGNEPPMPWKSVSRYVQDNGTIGVFTRRDGKGYVDVDLGREYVWVGEGKEKRHRKVYMRAERVGDYKFSIAEHSPGGAPIRRFVWDGKKFPPRIFHIWMEGRYKDRIKRRLRMTKDGRGFLSERQGKNLSINLGTGYENKILWTDIATLEDGKRREMRIDIYPNNTYDLSERIASRYYHPDEVFLLSAWYELRKRFWEWDPSRPAPPLLLVRVGANNKILFRTSSRQKEERRLLIYLPKSLNLEGRDVLVEFVPRNVEGRLVRGLRIYSIGPSGQASQLIYDRYYDTEEDKMIGQINIRKELAQQEQAALQLEAWLWGYLPPPANISDMVLRLDEDMKRATRLMNRLSLGKIFLSTYPENEQLIGQTKEALSEIRRHVDELTRLQNRERALSALVRYTNPIVEKFTHWEERLRDLERVSLKLGFADFLKGLGQREVFYQVGYQGRYMIIKGDDLVEIETKAEGVIKTIELKYLRGRSGTRFFIPWERRFSLRTATDEELMTEEDKYIGYAL